MPEAVEFARPSRQLVDEVEDTMVDALALQRGIRAAAQVADDLDAGCNALMQERLDGLAGIQRALEALAETVCGRLERIDGALRERGGDGQ
ncbi:MAG: hypothetical protein F4X35_05170 [Alphaproteobacteria bacterium]|nr:hypothetical protein [Alphaproteobacteria bacterium]